jgi:hypothetical protein
MANAFRVSNVAAIAMNSALIGLINAGGAGKIRIYTGTQPTNVEDAATGTLLGELTYAGTAFGTPTDANPGALATAAAITGDTSADNAGTAGYFRILSGASTSIAQGTCGTSGCDMNFNSAVISAGAAINCTAQTILVPEI